MFDTWVNANEGALKGAVGMAQGIGRTGPAMVPHRSQGGGGHLDGHDAKGACSIILLNPRGGPWKQTCRCSRSLLHLDDWRGDRPGLGLRREPLRRRGCCFFREPGKPVGRRKVLGQPRVAPRPRRTLPARRGRGGRAAGEACGRRGCRGALADIATAGSGLTKGLEGVTGNLPKIDPPVSGRPVVLPSEKPPRGAGRADTAPGGIRTAGCVAGPVTGRST